MSRFTSKPIGRAASQNCNVQRLYFPQRGDAFMYNDCGRKHFNKNNQSTILLPFEDIEPCRERRESRNNNLQFLEIDDIEGTKPTLHKSEGIKNKMKFYQLKLKREKEQQHDSLDYGLAEYESHSFKRHSVNPELQAYTKQRMYTEGDIQTIQPQPISHHQREFGQFSKKLKTNLQKYQQPIAEPYNKPPAQPYYQPKSRLRLQINPTYLSSVLN